MFTERGLAAIISSIVILFVLALALMACEDGDKYYHVPDGDAHTTTVKPGKGGTVKVKPKSK